MLCYSEGGQTTHSLDCVAQRDRSLHLKRNSKPDWAWSWATCLIWPCLSKEVGLGDLKRSFLTWMILWYALKFHLLFHQCNKQKPGSSLNSLTCTGGRTTPPYAASVMPFPSHKSSLPWSVVSHNKPLTRWSNISALPHLQGSSKILIFLLTAHCPPYLPHTSLYPLLTSPILQEVC